MTKTNPQMTTSGDADILRKAADLLESPNAWTKSGQLAINSSGIAVSAQSDAACSFCLLGAIDRALGDLIVCGWEQHDSVVALADTIRPGVFDEEKPTEESLIIIIGGFNDAPGTTLQMAVDALRETASRIEAVP